MSKRIAAITRLRDTRKGNPVYHVEFDDGSAANTVRDGPAGDYAGSFGWVGVDVDVEWDADRIASWKPAKPVPAAGVAGEAAVTP